MMTSTFPGSRSGSSQSLKGSLQDIQTKRDALVSLEAALKRRLNELRELCLKEGEITGQLPGDYPLQPREPIPQVRRRAPTTSSSASNSKSNLNDGSSISPTASSTSVGSSSQKLQDPVQPQSAYATPSRGGSAASQQVIFPPRPMSTNSTSSSISTASSNTRSISNQQPHTNMLATPKISTSTGGSNRPYPARNLLIRNNNNHHLQAQYDYSPMQTTLFRRPKEMPSNNSDTDLNGLMRTSSTTSSASSSGSAASSTLSTATIPNTRLNNNINMMNLHARSCSESMNHPSVAFQPTKAFTRDQEAYANQLKLKQQQQYPIMTSDRQLQNSSSTNSSNINLQPTRPPRGMTNDYQLQLQQQQHQPKQLLHQVKKFDSVDGDLKSISENHYKPPPSQQQPQKLTESSSLKALQHIKIDGKGSFVPYYEETKPFQMSDFYKYSSKHRQKTAAEEPATKTKTTRQLQEDGKRHPLKYSSCDDQKIQNSMRIIEKSGQKLIEATAKAIATNPGLAEKINSILPNPGDKY